MSGIDSKTVIYCPKTPITPNSDDYVRDDHGFTYGSNDDSITDLTVEEKLKVDRKKFEALLEGNDKCLGNADTFFGKIMDELPVVITWPPKLKTGTKSKKDPHVKISGLPAMVKSARIRISDSLDPRRDRVTLKMDVDWTAHSNIIGKAGTSIQKVMDSTGCHVHFPDANRTNDNEKSNQVSIAGTPEGVSGARNLIRDLLPLIVSFNLILQSGGTSSSLDRLNKAIQLVERLSFTQITLRFSTPKLFKPNATIITLFIRGVYSESNRVKLGTVLMKVFLNDLFKDNVIYEINTEISVQHHSFVMGSDKSNLKSIMKSTGAVITFPEPDTNQIFARLAVSTQPESQRKTTVNIKASDIDSVLMAFQVIQQYLPLSLTFDLKEGQEVKTSSIEMFSNTLNINISVKPKPKQNTKTIWIKGAEKDEQILFDVRRFLLEDNENSYKPMASIWEPNDLDFYSLKLNDIPDWNDTQELTEPLALSDNMGFNRAPGAERTLTSRHF